MSWQELKNLIQSLDEQHKGRKKGEPFEELVAELLGALLETRFETAKSGYQPIGDAINEERTIVLQTKNYNDETPLDRKEILGDIEEAELELPNLQTYVLAASRTIGNRLRNRFGDIEKKTGLDIVSLELTDKLSNLGALCVTFWEDIRGFLDSTNIDPEFLDWVEKTKPKTQKKIEELKSRLKQGQQSRNWVQKDTEKYLLKRFGSDSNHSLRFNYSIDLSEAIERESLESEIATWWETSGKPVCYLEGEEGMGKSWLAAKSVNTICSDRHIASFWLDSNRWNGCRSLDNLLQACLETIPGYQEKRKIARLKLKIRNIWWTPTLIVLDGVNEAEALEAAKRILDEYFTHRDQLENKIRFLLTTRPLDAYRNFEHNLWEGCHRIPVESFNNPELQDALRKEGLQPDDLPDSLKKVARIPRYFRTCIQLRELFHSFDNVTKEMVLWADLLHKIKHTDPQVREKFDWQNVEEVQEDLAKLAREVKWPNVDDAPQASLRLLIDCFPNYREIRRDLEEQRIALKAHKRQAELSEDHVVLGWAIYLSNLFDSMEFSDIESLFERFRQELEPIPSEDLRTKALFIALQITAISPNPDISQDQLSQRRAALMLAWFNSHNAQITDEQLSFWAEKDTDAYAQVVEFEFEYHNSSNYEDALIKPLAKTWLNKKGDLNRLASCLTKWFLPTYTEEPPKDPFYIHITEQRFPREKDDIQFGLLDAAVSILSQRPERQFLKTLARCYGTLYSNERFNSDIGIGRRLQFHERIGRLMRWGYTEEVVGDLHWLAELAQANEILLRGVYGLADCLRVDLRPRLQRPLSEKELETRAFLEEDNRRFKPYIDRIRNQERLLIGDSPAANGNYHGLNYLAVRTDLPDWHHEDIVEIKKILQDVSVNAKLGQTREGFCIENLMPWVARYDPESYAELACNLKINTLNQEWAQIVLSSIQGLIFKPETCTKITEAILEMKQRLHQEIQADDSSNTIYLTSLLTETLLFSAPEDKLIDWFEFLASHEALRKSIFTETLQVLLNKLLSEPVVRFVQQKLKIPRSSSLDNQFPSNIESEKITEEDFWWWIYLCISDNDENVVTWALKNLKRRKSNVHSITFYSLHKATLDSNRFLSEVFTDKNVRKHLFLKDRRFFPTPIYKGENSYSYENLVSVLPQEIVGSFLCSPERCADLARWGKELIEKKCSILQGAKVDFDHYEEMRFCVNPKVLQNWAEQNKDDFLCLADEYLTKLCKSPRYHRVSRKFTEAVFCLLLRFQPTVAMEHYHQWNAKNFQPVYGTPYGIPIHVFQLWHVKDFNLSEHHDLRCRLLEECLNDEKIMFMTLAALVGGGEKELWNLVTQKYLVSPYAKQRNLGVSILPWFGTDEAIEKLDQLKSKDSSKWVRGHAAWAYEVAQQERSCQEVYREALQARDIFRISAILEQIEPALSPIARWWHYEIEEEENIMELQDNNPKLFALLFRFWVRWGNSSRTKNNVEVFNRKLREYCRGEQLSAGSTPRIAPWWKPTSDSDNW